MAITRTQAKTPRDTEQFLNDLLSSSAILVWQADPQTRFTFLNQSWETVFGYKMEEMIGREFVDFQGVENGNTDITSFLNTLEPDIEKKHEFVFADKTGNRINLLIHARLLKDEKNAIIGARGIAVSIAGQSGVNASVDTYVSTDAYVSPGGMKLNKDIKDYYTEVIESTDTGFVLITEEGIVVLANENYLRLTGRASLDEITGHSVLEWTAPYDVKRNEYEVRQCIDKGCINFLEIDYQHADGTILHVEIIANTIETKEGKRIITLCRDISERKETLRLLDVSTSLVQSLINTANVIIAGMSADGIIQIFNPYAVEITGFTLSEVVGKNWFDLLQPRSILPEAWSNFRRIKTGESHEYTENSIFTKSGAERFFLWRHSLLYESGSLTGILLFGIDITEQRQMHKTIRESEAMLRQSQRIARIGHYSLNIPANTWTASEMFYEIHGIDGEFRLTIQNLAGLIHQDDRREIYNQLTIDAIKNKIPFDNDYRIIRVSDQEIRWVHGIGNLEFDEQGNAVRMLGTVQDITEKKNAAAELELSEDRFRKIFQEGQFGIAISGKDFRFVMANPAFCRMLGYTEQELAGMTFKDITHPDHLIIDTENVASVIRGEQPRYATEKRYIRKNGEIIWGSLVGSMVRDKEGKLAYFLAMIQNITKRKAAEEALAAEKERLSVTLHSIGDGVITTDKNSQILTINMVGEILTGWPREEAVGKPIDQVFHVINELTGKACENPVAAVLSSGMVTEHSGNTILISRSDGRKVIAHNSAPIKNESGETIGVVLVFRDMTEKQRLMDNAQKIQKLESLGVLAGGIAHDFNNLLSGIYGNIELAKILSRDVQVINHLNMTLMTINRARGLTQQMLTFAKGGSPVLKTQNLNPLITETVRFALSGSNITCNFNIPEELWFCDIDANQISQVIENITINAIQAMPLGGVMTVSCNNTLIGEKDYPFLKPGCYVRISIRDEGIGIPKDIQARIFDPFFTTKQGSGLGLSTSYSIVHRHGGFLEVESEPGAGSLFHILIPASASEDKKTDSRKPEGSITRGSGRILIMDDEEVIRTTLSRMLKMLGYMAIVAKEGRETLDIYKKEIAGGNGFKAIILDLTVHGGMGGIETIAGLKTLDSTIPVFVSTGYAEDSIISHPEQYGFTGSIKKPYTLTELSALLKSISDVKPQT